MNFYQQKYYQPYRKINNDPLSNSNNRSTHNRQSEPDSYDNSYVDYEYKRAPVFERSPGQHVVHTRVTEEPIWEHLYNEGKKSKKELLDRHENSKYKIDIQCTFQPIIKQNKRYLDHSNSSFLGRVNLWHEQKIQKKVKQKEQQVNTDLRECTFTPKINNRSKKTVSQYAQLREDKSQKYLNERSGNINHSYYSPIKTSYKKSSPRPSPLQPSYNKQASSSKKLSLSPSPLKQGGGGVEIDAAMRMIKNQLRRLAI